MITSPVQFFTTGFGEWRRVLPAGEVREFYGRIYPHGIPWEALPTPMLQACRVWVECDLARADGDRLTPLIPILTQTDRHLLRPWLAALASQTAAIVGDALPAFRRLAEQFSDRRNTTEHIVSILILWSINMWVLRRLLAGPIGRHPAHGDTGRYFIWGEELGQGPTFITGIRATRGATGYGLCVIISRIVDRPGLKDARRLYAQVGGVSAIDLLTNLHAYQTSLPTLAQQWRVEITTLQRWLDEQRSVRVITCDEPPRVRVPIFDAQAVTQIAPVCGGVARQIMDWLLKDTLLEPLLERCSFAHCPRPAVLCMLWHNSYYEATDRLIAQSVLPAFPSVAEGEWGVWLTSHPYGPSLADLDSSG
ncbi:MAG TPA: hypothetical protein VLK82_20820 [Candidatus Tectomicrobia bacterium]|nr:hypothetical protein [Candidatus Tectomicrobia bacterium]